MFNESIDGCKNILVARHIIEGTGTIFLNPVHASVVKPRGVICIPWQVVLCLNWKVCNNPLLLGGGVEGAKLDGFF